MDCPLISVIVPVYNVEKYLRKCVESICAQTYSNLEIILVDDGAKDSSGVICDDLAKEDARVKVIHKLNGGLSSARNAGLDVATGEYIAFVDSDDWIDSQMYEKMYEALMITGADMVSCGMEYVYEDGRPSEFVSGVLDSQNEYEVVEKENIFHQLVERDCATVVQWNKLYQRKVFKNLRFKEGKFHEDVFIIHNELTSANSLVYMKAPFYKYLQRSGSIMHTDEDIRQIKDAVEGYQDRIDFFNDIKELAARDESVLSLYKYIKWKFDNSLNRDLLGLLEKVVDDNEKYASPEKDILELLENPRRYIFQIKKIRAKAKIKRLLQNNE